MEEKRYPELNEEQGIVPSYGPFSEEEAVARIDRFEERLARGEVRWTSSEEFTKQLYEELPWLR